MNRLPMKDPIETERLVREECRRHGIVCDPDKVFSWMSRFEDRTAGEQLPLFG